MADNSKQQPPITDPWTLPLQELLEEIDSNPEQGLPDREIKQRRRRYGSNRLRSVETRSPWQILVEQFKSVVVLLLVVAAGASFLFGQIEEGIAIAVVIVINAAIGFATEYRAVRSMEALQRLGSVETKVRRNGKVQEISAEKLVPGDIVIVKGGDLVTADLRLIEASKLQANESALTGESVPVSKEVGELEQEVSLAERSNMLFKGTAVTRGAGEGVVVATGMDTELGHISSLVEEAEEEITPLERRLDRLGQQLVWVTLGIAAVVALTGILVGRELLLVVETSLALAVATVPEGLPIVATVALARGMWRMARRNALINRLSAVETLGATNVICTDKTGTLTENRMTVTYLDLPLGEIKVGGEGLELEGAFRHQGERLDPRQQSGLRAALEVGVLCNNATLRQSDSGEEVQAVGEPMEVALLVLGAKADIKRSDLIDQNPEVREVAFEPDTKMMATYHRQNGSLRVAVKGAAEAVLESSSHVQAEDERRPLNASDQERWSKKNEQLAADGYRVLALAQKNVPDEETPPYEELTFLGLLALIDPPREEVAPSLAACKEAGIQVVMVTGDHPATARNVARAVHLLEEDKEARVIRGSDLKQPQEYSDEERQDLLDARVFARVSPEQKLDLIALYQDRGYVVAMTGDGVNDAPALKKADIGVAMGKRGTQVAREASDMVLEDDAFSSIVAAVEQGRVIFNNIRKFVLYLLSCNVSEVMIVALASLINAPLPILPLQILFLNLVTDVFPALALGMGEGGAQIMDRPPRDPEEAILIRRHWLSIAGYGSVITAAVLGVFALALEVLGMSDGEAVTISFLSLAFAQLWHVFNMRNRGSRFLRNEITLNPYVWGALALCTGLLLAAVYLPGLSDLLRITPPGFQGWGLILAASALPWMGGQLYHFMQRSLS